jgi:uncharacterized membrane protein
VEAGLRDIIVGEVFGMSILRIALLVMTLLPALWAQSYSFQQFSVPGRKTMASSINNRGAIVGDFFTGGGFKRDADGVFEFPLAGYYPSAINDSGVIVGQYDVGLHSHGFLLTGGVHGTYTTVDVPPGPDTLIYGINNLGDFAGYTGDLSTIGQTHGFVSIGGVITQIDVPGAIETEAFAVAWDGTVVGSYLEYVNGIAVWYGFVRGPQGNLVGFQVPNSRSIFPFGINNEAGLIVGTYWDNSARPHGFVYNYVADLAALDGASANPVRTVSVQTVDYPGRYRTRLFGVNAKGVLVGYVISKGPTVSYVSFTATPVP